MHRWIAGAALGVLLSLMIVCGFTCWGIWRLTQTADGIRADVNAQTTVIADHATQAMDQVTYSVDDVERQVVRPCRGKAGPDACGTLAQLNKTIIKAGDAVVTTQLEERKAVDAAASASKAMSRAAASIAGTAQAATVTLDELSDPETGITPTMGAYRQAGDNLNALLKQKAIAQTFDNVDRLTAASAGTMENLKGITADVKIETDAMVAPKTKKQRVLEFAPPVFKLGITTLCVIAGPC